jgi:transcriptional regulator
MYLPTHFEERNPERLRQLVREHPLGLLVMLQSGVLNANHLPFVWDEDASAHGILRAHVARANPLWREVDSSVEALVAFQGAQGYITPSWYETKKETGKVVPSYNYLVVHAYGALRVIDDRKWVREFVERLTRKFEATRTAPWEVSDAPPDFIDKQLEAIVGLEIPITRVQGKWKASQNRPLADQRGVVSGLKDLGTDDARAMATAIETRQDDSSSSDSPRRV